MILTRPSNLLERWILDVFPPPFIAICRALTIYQLGHAWKVRYAATCLTASAHHVFSPRTPPYTALLEIDKKIRKFAMPSHLRSPTRNSETGRSWSTDPSRAMQQYCALCLRESSSLFRSPLTTLTPDLMQTSSIYTGVISFKQFVKIQTTRCGTSMLPRCWQLIEALVGSYQASRVYIPFILAYQATVGTFGLGYFPLVYGSFSLDLLLFVYIRLRSFSGPLSSKVQAVHLRETLCVN
jgi:hypothetical protein